MPTPSPASKGLTTSPAPAGAWQLRLLGAVEARLGDERITRWPSRAAAALLARLALAPQRTHPREELVELLWPGVALDVGRNRLRQALSTLRSLLDGPDGSRADVVDADRGSIRLLPGRVVCDAVDFERHVRAGDWAAARQAYGGDLMPGFYDDWVIEARAHLAALHDRVEAQPPAPPPVPTPVDPLPASWTRVFGIEHSATRLLALLRHERLVTVVGPGGCGKTRLSLEAARALREGPAWSMTPESGSPPAVRFARIVFVPLADCEDEAQAAAALARALHVSGREPMQQVRTLLSGAPVLLVLDNFEQLVGSTQGLLLQLLESVPTLHLLVTSRLRLGLPGEQVFPLGGLPLPEADLPLQTAALNPAVALFADRARAARPDFHLGTAELPAVCALVRCLDGIPLALELAASRVGSFSPAQMLRLLTEVGPGDAHLSLLSRSGPRAGHDPRHASMSQVIAWSWRLLDPPAQATLTALSAFAGDAGLPGVAALLDEPPSRVAARLDDLAGHSLLRVLAPQDGRVDARFALVEPVREFVRAQGSPAALLQVQQRLQAWLLDWARSLGPAPAPAAVEAELRSVLSMLAQAAPDPQATLGLALALRPHWESAGMPAGLQSCLETALGTLGVAPSTAGLRSEAHELLAYLRFEAGFTAESRAHADAALRHAGPDASRRSRALVRRAWVDLATGRGEDDPSPHTARLLGWLDEALALGQAAGDREAQARALHQLAVVASHLQHDWVRAEDLLARSQALWQALGDRRKAFARLRNRAQCWVRLGRTDEALACFERCEQAALQDGDWVGQIDSLLSLSTLLSGRRQWQAALDLDRRCVALCWQRWHRHGLGYALWNPPRALAHLRRPEAALRLMAFATGFWESNFGPLSRSDRLVVRRVRGLARVQVGQARADALWAEGMAMDIASAVGLALQA